MLLMVPQSHTCDNILELPNYWKALNKVNESDQVDGRGRGGPREVAMVKQILREKLLIAIENAKGYGLDAIHEENGSEGGAFNDGRSSLGALLGRSPRDAGSAEESCNDISFNIPELGESRRSSLGSMKDDDDANIEGKEAGRGSGGSRPNNFAASKGQDDGGDDEGEEDEYSEDEYEDSFENSFEMEDLP